MNKGCYKEIKLAFISGIFLCKNIITAKILQYIGYLIFYS